FFSIFDGHAGKQAAEWCGNHFHEIFQDVLQKHANISVQEIFNCAFLRADEQLNQNAGKHSGCTAVTAFLRSEEITNGNDINAVRLSYDHKGSDPQEAKRIVEAGGFVMNNRVNGVLAVTRSLGDYSMKDFVIGKPYTTETTLTEKDPFLILACD
ncbi:1180_t:CDS:2, partial [Racocetra fulgida]